MSYRLPFEIDPMGYDEALAALADILCIGISPMLETVVDMLEEAGRPDATFDVVQIGGTNGKTSTSRFTAALLASTGRKVALYTSPELVRYNERMEVDGAPVSDDEFAYGISAAIEAGRRVNARRVAAGEKPYDVTEFDTLTVAAMVAFARAGVDVAVLEVGMGGRWDATSATHPVSTCVTGIGLDHTRILGDTLELIAAEKAAIIKPGQTCVLGEGVLEKATVFDVFADACRGAGTDPVVVTRLGADYPVDLDSYALSTYDVSHAPSFVGDELVVDVTTPLGIYPSICCRKPSYQATNIACAVTLAERYLGAPLDASRVADAIAACPTPGRFDVVSTEPLRLVDAAHNPQSVERFLASLETCAPDKASRPALLAAVLADKDVDGIVALLADAFETVYVTQTSSARALPADALAAAFEARGAGVAGVYDSVDSALADLFGTGLVCVGSITLAGEVAAACGFGRRP
jgi:dihydrofolate synthase/folylpolyglutamate synthase